jgi:hypothetical protein
MKEYLIGVLAVSALASLGALLSYKEDDKSVRLAFSVLLAFAVLMPLSGAVGSFASGGLPSIELPDGSTEGEYIEVARSAFCEGVKSMVCLKFSLESEEVALGVSGFDFESMRCDTVELTLYGKAAFADFDALEKYIKESLGGCNVKICIG